MSSVKIRPKGDGSSPIRTESAICACTPDGHPAMAQTIHQRLQGLARVKMRLVRIVKLAGKAPRQSGFKLCNLVGTDARVADCTGGEPVEFCPVAGRGHDQSAMPHDAGQPCGPPVVGNGSQPRHLGRGTFALDKGGQYPPASQLAPAPSGPLSTTSTDRPRSDSAVAAHSPATPAPRMVIIP